MATLEWIKLTCDLPDKWQTHKLRRILKLRTIDEVIGKLFRLWRHFENQSRRGHIQGVTAEDIDTIIGRKGFAVAVAEVGWLTLHDDGGATVPNFDEYMGGVSRKRDADAERLRAQRAAEAEAAAIAAAESTVTGDGDTVATSTRHESETPATRPRHKRDTVATSTRHESVRNATQERDLDLGLKPLPETGENEKLSDPQSPVNSPQTAPQTAEKSTEIHDHPTADQNPVGKSKRARDPLFDAIVEVCGVEPATNGSVIGLAKKELSGADPPYTPDEVRAFGRKFWELCSWAKKDGRSRPTVPELKKHIGGVRASPLSNPAASSPQPFDPTEQAQRNREKIEKSSTRVVPLGITEGVNE